MHFPVFALFHGILSQVSVPFQITLAPEPAILALYILQSSTVKTFGIFEQHNISSLHHPPLNSLA